MINIFDISHLCGIKISGPDALRFCQAQFTFDANLLTAAAWQPGAWCDVKGRCLIVILARFNEGEVELILPNSQKNQLDRLKLFAIGHEVQFGAPSPVSGSLSVIAGTATLPGPYPRSLQLVSDRASIDQAAIERWRQADFKTPLPWLKPVTSGQHLPQFLGLEHNQGLCYTKGCYPGQEIVARVHYLGKVKRHLLGFRTEATDNPPPDPGTKLLDRNEKDAGSVLDSLVIDGETIGLAVCPVEIGPGTSLQTQADNFSQPIEMAPPESL